MCHQVTISSNQNSCKKRNLTLRNCMSLQKGHGQRKRVSLICDGWTNHQRRPPINGNREEQYKEKIFISNLIKDVTMMIDLRILFRLSQIML